MRILTTTRGLVENGVEVGTFKTSGGAEFPAVMVGSDGRGRRLGVMPVEDAEAGAVLERGEVGTTKAGKPKLIARPDDATGGSTDLLCVMRTQHGYRGSAGYSGDLTGWRCQVCKTEGKDDLPAECPECGSIYDRYGGLGPVHTFHEFPGTILVTGTIADGAAGRMGGCEQRICRMPAGAIWRTWYSGRLYGGANHHYWYWDGGELLVATRDERDLFGKF